VRSPEETDTGVSTTDTSKGGAAAVVGSEVLDPDLVTSGDEGTERAGDEPKVTDMLIPRGVCGGPAKEGPNNAPVTAVTTLSTADAGLEATVPADAPTPAKGDATCSEFVASCDVTVLTGEGFIAASAALARAVTSMFMMGSVRSTDERPKKEDGLDRALLMDNAAFMASTVSSKSLFDDLTASRSRVT
jgi:hypothetical protein